MNFLEEWNASCVDERITVLNVTPLEGNGPYDYLFYSDAIPRRNDGRIRDRQLKQYRHIEEGGWWCSGMNLLAGEEDLWGCFKPNQPRLSRDRNRPIKYEHPPKTATGVFALRVPPPIWETIAQRHSPDTCPQNSSLPNFGFWQWLIENPQIPVCLTEGAKKAGALLTAGYAAIALPGVNSGYRTPRYENGDRAGKSQLIPQLQVLATPNRPIYLVFDQDSQPKTIKAVRAAIRQTAFLLKQQGCTVKIVTWNPQWGKGADDLIAARGTEAFDRAFEEALPLDLWKARTFRQLTHSPAREFNDRYLPCNPAIVPPHLNTSLIAIQSPKGTGKTQHLQRIARNAIASNQRVLVIGHRVQLVEDLCQRFGLPTIAQIRTGQSAELGCGLCIDSLHPNSQAQFRVRDWEGATVIIDEIEQVLWHCLNSSTCTSQRAAILKTFKSLVQTILGGSGRLYVADADLSDVSLDYLLTLAGVQQQPFIVQNRWKPSEDEAWTVYNYPETTPDRLVGDLVQHIREGGKPFVCLSAQKLTSQWGTRALEAYLHKQFPKARILRIDSETVAEPNRCREGCIPRLNDILLNYDIVLASPSIETGVSLDLCGHFTSVWAIAQGIQGESSVRQSLSRIRDNIPRHIWVAPYGFNQVGNGSTSIPGLLDSGQKLTRLNIRLLQQADFEAIDDLDTGFQAESLLCWAKFAVRFNATMLQYREAVLAGLRGEGHRIVEMPPPETIKVSSSSRRKGGLKSARESSQNAIADAINAVREQNYRLECEAIAAAPELNDCEYQALKRQMVKTVQERRQERKYELKVRYGLPVVPELVVKDDGGWYAKLRLHYFLTVGRSQLRARDAAVAKQLLEQGEGSIFLPDFNRSQLGAIVGTMERLGLPALLQDRQRELRNTDLDLQAMAAIALSSRSALKTITGLRLAKNSSPAMVVRRFLELLGYGLRYVRIEGNSARTGKKRVRVYCVERPDDGRDRVFKYWLERFGGVEIEFEEGLRLSKAPHLPESEQSRYVQLSLLSINN
ncbi:MAG: plasmid replication protein, CyRepA1 family [Cyanobacteriota bacterium]|nr:plasmid replication protein, CyRepA1 family [Cyanobacteriota bacterium]